MMFTVFCAGKRVHDVLRGKTSSRRFARENMFTVFCAGKHVHGVLRGKICSLSFAREDTLGKSVENTSLLSRSEKHSTGVKFGVNKFKVSDVANKSNLR